MSSIADRPSSRFVRLTSFRLLLLVAGFVSALTPCFAQTRTWLGNNGTANQQRQWQRTGNWTGGNVPDSPGETAVFGANGNATPLTSNSSDYEIGGIIFSPSAQSFTATVQGWFTLSGTGVINDSAVAQTINARADFIFKNNATASGGSGPAVTFNNTGTTSTVVAYLSFEDTATAGKAVINNSSATVAESDFFLAGVHFSGSSTAGTSAISSIASGPGTSYAEILFFEDASAGDATITSHSSVLGFNGYGQVSFQDRASAAQSIITISGDSVETASFLFFANEATAGSSHINVGSYGTVQFDGASTAGNATITSVIDNGMISFNENSTAGQATINSAVQVNFSSQTSADQAQITMDHKNVIFYDTATAGQADITLTNLSTAYFQNASTAGEATINVETDSLALFVNESTGGNAALNLIDGGDADFGLSAASDLSIGSIAGTGTVFLGDKRLMVGGNNASTTFAGTIEDGGFHSGTGGGITKVGTGTLTLAGANSYTGGTVVTEGTLTVAHEDALGEGDVTIEGGSLSIQTGFSATNRINLAGGTLERSFDAGSNLAGAIAVTSDFGGPSTGATIVAGEAGGISNISATFSAGPGGTVSDILHLSGLYSNPETGVTDLFVLELSLTSVEPGTYLGWLNGADEWVNAALGNTGNNADQLTQTNYAGSFAEFQEEFGNDLSSYVGAWGFTSTTVWTVLNHNSDFAAVPEPSTALLLILGGMAFMVLCRRRQTG